MANISRRHDALFRLQSFLTDAREAPKTPMQKRWERRWTAATGASFAVLAALLLRGIDWSAALMVTATAFMLARGGDMLDNYDESPLPSPAVPALLPAQRAVDIDTKQIDGDRRTDEVMQTGASN